MPESNAELQTFEITPAITVLKSTKIIKKIPHAKQIWDFSILLQLRTPKIPATRYKIPWIEEVAALSWAFCTVSPIS